MQLLFQCRQVFPFSAVRCFQVDGTINSLGASVLGVRGITDNSFEISAKDLPAGIYFYRVLSMRGAVAAGRLPVY